MNEINSNWSFLDSKDSLCQNVVYENKTFMPRIFEKLAQKSLNMTH